MKLTTTKYNVMWVYWVYGANVLLNSTATVVNKKFYLKILFFSFLFNFHSFSKLKPVLHHIQ